MLSDAPASGTACRHVLQCDATDFVTCRLVCVQEQGHKPGSTRHAGVMTGGSDTNHEEDPSGRRNIGLNACLLEVAAEMIGIVPRRQWLSDLDSLKLGLSPVSLACMICSGSLLPVMRQTYTGSSSACRLVQIGSEPDWTTSS